MKVIRDAIHGDLEFSRDEMRIIHTPGFQRLHGCRQLGLTHLVYPCAKHSRFEHVLGVTHMATKIARTLRDQERALFLDPKDDFFAQDESEISLGKTLRLAALLHDMGHVPFGHTLEDEMPIIPKHDDPSDKETPSRMDAAVSDVLRLSGNERYIEPVKQVLLAIAESKKDDELYELVDAGKIRAEHVILADIIGNTLCADLLDYIKRDHVMTGIRATYDERILRYFGLGDHCFAGKTYKRVVIKLVRHGRVRNDALADLLDILKLRYNLSDKVLFHPNKCAADAMLIKAISLKGIKADDLMGYSDDGLLDSLSKEPLIEMLRRRDLFKLVFRCGLADITTFQQVPKEEVLGNLHRNNDDIRSRIESAVTERLSLRFGNTSVLIFCPQPQMTLKPVRTLVLWKDGTVRRLNEIDSRVDLLTSQQVGLLQDIYPQLWKLYLFVHPSLRSRGCEIRRTFEEILKVETQLNAVCDPALEHYLETGCDDYIMGKILYDELQNVPEYLTKQAKNRSAVWDRCWEKLANEAELAAVDDRFQDTTGKTLYSRQKGGEEQLRNRARAIIGTILPSGNKEKRQPGELDFPREG